MALGVGAIRDAILGLALLFVALRRSQFAGVTAVIVATFLTFLVLASVLMSVAFRPFHASWWDAIYLTIAVAILWPSLFPWSRSANKPVLFWMCLTFAAATLLFGSPIVLARL